MKTVQCSQRFLNLILYDTNSKCRNQNPLIDSDEYKNNINEAKHFRAFAY